eukprot:SAG31_NODE_5831_length_2304_cov_1.903401_3_plen_61_part_00
MISPVAAAIQIAPLRQSDAGRVFGAILGFWTIALPALVEVVCLSTSLSAIPLDDDASVHH